MTLYNKVPAVVFTKEYTRQLLASTRGCGGCWDPGMGFFLAASKVFRRGATSCKRSTARRSKAAKQAPMWCLSTPSTTSVPLQDMLLPCKKHPSKPTLSSIPNEVMYNVGCLITDKFMQRQ